MSGPVRRPPPPRTAPPISTEEMTVIKKRVSAPKAPPPKNLEGFRPKSMNTGMTMHDGDYQKETDDRGRRRSSRDEDDSMTGRSTTDYDDDRRRRHSSDDDRDWNGRSHAGEDDRRRRSPVDEWNSHQNSTRNISSSRYSDGESDMMNSHSKQSHVGSRRYDDDKNYDRDYDDRSRNSKRSQSPNSMSDDKLRRSQSDDNGSKSLKGKRSVSGRLARNGRDWIFNFRDNGILDATYKELRTFVKTPCAAGVVVRCYIERSRSVGKNFLTPTYTLCADMEDGSGKQLITCRKIFKSKTSHYVFSMRETDLFRKRENRSRVYLGKLRAVSSSEYVLYDSGSTPREDLVTPGNISSDEEDEDEKHDNDENDFINLAEEDAVFKSQLCSIFYYSKTRPTAGLGMEVCVPTVPSRTQPILGDLRTDLKECFTKIREEKMQNELYANKCFIIQEKKSRYDPVSSCLVDYQGRAIISSVKNFQLLESTPYRLGPRKQNEKASDDEIIFQMGKVSRIVIEWTNVLFVCATVV